MKKSIGELIDSLGVTNIKIFYLIDKVLKDEHTREDAKKIQDLNRLRNDLINAINKYFKDRKEIKV